ncbi:MAG: tetratricopeptide repeat protein [Rhizobiales bacterium]|nr:tetratricopeptide repeat protein [Hyphomicrobiales bacterium]
MLTRLYTSTFIALAAGLMLVGSVFAAGNGGNSGSSGAQNCKSGEVWSNSLKRCVKSSSGIVPDDDLYAQGRELAIAGEFDRAIEVLEAIRDKDEAGILNYLGYAHRKAGMIDKGIAYYHQALAIDPDYVLAREYLGEGYVAAGNVDLARQQLQEIGARCGTNCEEYIELAEVIASAQ